MSKQQQSSSAAANLGAASTGMTTQLLSGDTFLCDDSGEIVEQRYRITKAVAEEGNRLAQLHSLVAGSDGGVDMTTLDSTEAPAAAGGGAVLPTKILPLRPRTKLEQQQMERIPERQKANQTKVQSVMGKTFSGAGFVADPPELTFSDFLVGVPQTQTIKLTNVSLSSNGFRVLPLPGKIIDTVDVQYAPVSALPAGMSVNMTVTFCAKENVDIKNISIPLLTQTGPMEIPLTASIRRPDIEVNVSNLEFNAVVIGERKKVTLVVRNVGSVGVRMSVHGEFIEDVLPGLVTTASGGGLTPRGEAAADGLMASTSNVKAGIPFFDMMPKASMLGNVLLAPCSAAFNPNSKAAKAGTQKAAPSTPSTLGSDGTVTITVTFSPLQPVDVDSSMFLSFDHPDLHDICLLVRARGVDVPVYIDQNAHLDFGCCFQGTMYRDTFTVKNTTRAAVKVTPQIPMQLIQALGVNRRSRGGSMSPSKNASGTSAFDGMASGTETPNGGSGGGGISTDAGLLEFVPPFAFVQPDGGTMDFQVKFTPSKGNLRGLRRLAGAAGGGGSINGTRPSTSEGATTEEQSGVFGGETSTRGGGRSTARGDVIVTTLTPPSVAASLAAEAAPQQQREGRKERVGGGSSVGSHQGADGATADLQLQAAIRVNVQGQAMPLTLNVKATFTKKRLVFTPSQLHFGAMLPNEALTRTVTIFNDALLPRTLGFIKLPSNITVEPSLATFVLLPRESLQVKVTVRPPSASAAGLAMQTKFQHSMTLLSDTDDSYHIPVTGSVRNPLLQMTPPQICLPPCPLGGMVSGIVVLKNVQSPAAAGGSGDVVVNTAQRFSFGSTSWRYGLSFSPSTGELRPGESLAIEVTFRAHPSMMEPMVVPPIITEDMLNAGAIPPGIDASTIPAGLLADPRSLSPASEARPGSRNDAPAAAKGGAASAASPAKKKTKADEENERAEKLRLEELRKLWLEERRKEREKLMLEASSFIPWEVGASGDAPPEPYYNTGALTADVVAPVHSSAQDTTKNGTTRRASNLAGANTQKRGSSAGMGGKSVLTSGGKTALVVVPERTAVAPKAGAGNRAAGGASTEPWSKHRTVLIPCFLEKWAARAQFLQIRCVVVAPSVIATVTGQPRPSSLLSMFQLPAGMSAAVSSPGSNTTGNNNAVKPVGLELSFGDVPALTSTEQRFTLWNILPPVEGGNVVSVAIHPLGPDGPFHVVKPPAPEVAPGCSTDVVIRFSPRLEAYYRQTLTVLTTTQGGMCQRVILLAVGRALPTSLSIATEKPNVDAKATAPTAGAAKAPAPPAKGAPVAATAAAPVKPAVASGAPVSVYDELMAPAATKTAFQGPVVINFGHCGLVHSNTLSIAPPPTTSTTSGATGATTDAAAAASAPLFAPSEQPLFFTNHSPFPLSVKIVFDEDEEYNLAARLQQQQQQAQQLAAGGGGGSGAASGSKAGGKRGSTATSMLAGDYGPRNPNGTNAFAITPQSFTVPGNGVVQAVATFAPGLNTTYRTVARAIFGGQGTWHDIALSGVGSTKGMYVVFPKQIALGPVAGLSTTAASTTAAGAGKAEAAKPAAGSPVVAPVAPVVPPPAWALREEPEEDPLLSMNTRDIFSILGAAMGAGFEGGWRGEDNAAGDKAPPAAGAEKGTTASTPSKAGSTVAAVAPVLGGNDATTSVPPLPGTSAAFPYTLEFQTTTAAPAKGDDLPAGGLTAAGPAVGSGASAARATNSREGGTRSGSTPPPGGRLSPTNGAPSSQPSSSGNLVAQHVIVLGNIKGSTNGEFTLDPIPESEAAYGWKAELQSVSGGPSGASSSGAAAAAAGGLKGPLLPGTKQQLVMTFAPTPALLDAIPLPGVRAMSSCMLRLTLKGGTVGSVASPGVPPSDQVFYILMKGAAVR